MKSIKSGIYRLGWSIDQFNVYGEFCVFNKNIMEGGI